MWSRNNLHAINHTIHVRYLKVQKDREIYRRMCHLACLCSVKNKRKLCMHLSLIGMHLWRYGKSLCYALLLIVLDVKRGLVEKSYGSVATHSPDERPITYNGWNELHVKISYLWQYTKHGWPKTMQECPQPYWNRRDDLSLQGSCLLWGVRVIVPKKL